MKKIFALVLVVVVCMGSCFLTSCALVGLGLEIDEVPGNYKLDDGSYNYVTYELKDYQAFLEECDTKGYIVNDHGFCVDDITLWFKDFYKVNYTKPEDSAVQVPDTEPVTSVPTPSQKEPQNSNNQVHPTQTTISVKEILQNSENYIVIATDNAVTMVPKTVAEFVISNESNLLILEKTDSTIAKATFCVTQEMLTSIE